MRKQARVDDGDIQATTELDRLRSRHALGIHDDVLEALDIVLYGDPDKIPDAIFGAAYRVARKWFDELLMEQGISEYGPLTMPWEETE